MKVRSWLAQHAWLRLWLPVVAWMGLIFFLSSQPDLPHPESGWLDNLFGVGAHTLEYGVLAALLSRALANRKRAGLLVFAVGVLYALSDEFHQAFVPGRTPDPWDLLCDALGVLLGLAAWAWLTPQKAGR